ncbi:MAG: hypothetical protein JJU02_05680 [Cryomorphaceae bacterium]|nr:hypothetical protein [Cryomorphaceae bacterium]
MDQLHVIVKSANRDKFGAYLSEFPEKFNVVIDLALCEKTPYAWRCVWMLNHSLKNNNLRLKPFANKLIQSVSGKMDGHQRELLKLIGKIPLGENEEGRLFNTCLSIWEDVGKQPGVRFVAFKFMIKLGNKYPELLPEIMSLAQTQYMQSLSPGIRKSLQKMIDKQIIVQQTP